MLLKLFLLLVDYSVVAVWNSLPDSIRDSAIIDIFKRKAKTHLFNAAFVA